MGGGGWIGNRRPKIAKEIYKKRKRQKRKPKLGQTGKEEKVGDDRRVEDRETESLDRGGQLINE